MKVGNVFNRIYHEFLSWEPVWLFLNRRARKEWREENPDLDDEQKRIVSEIKQNGIAVSNVDKLGFSDLFMEMKKFTEKRLSDPDVIAEKEAKKHLTPIRRGDKPHWVFLMGGGKWIGKLDRQNPFIKFSLSKKIMDIAGGYLKMKPVFNSFYLTSTMIMPKGAEPILSQRWHRDPEDKKIVRVFVCLNDIDELTGPFVYALGSHYYGKWGHLFPQRRPAGIYPAKGEVERKIPKENMKICTAPAGTVVFADTAGIHKGGYSIAKSRLLSLSLFTSPASTYPANYVM